MLLLCSSVSRLTTIELSIYYGTAHETALARSQLPSTTGSMRPSAAFGALTKGCFGRRLLQLFVLVILAIHCSALYAMAPLCIKCRDLSAKGGRRALTVHQKSCKVHQEIILQASQSVKIELEEKRKRKA